MLRVVNPYTYSMNISNKCFSLQLCIVYVKPTKYALVEEPTRGKCSATWADYWYNQEDSECYEHSQTAEFAVIAKARLHSQLLWNYLLTASIS